MVDQCLPHSGDKLFLQTFRLIFYYSMSSEDFHMHVAFFLLMREVLELAGMSGNEKV